MAKYDLSKREDEIKNLVRDDWFGKYDGNRSIGNIDFSVCMPTDPNQLEIFDLDFFLWAEAKKGNREDIDDSLVQLIMTIMKARTYNDYLPPLYLGAFDAEKIAFIPYDDKLQRQVIFDQILENDIDWTRVTPSDHSSKDFAKVKKKAKDILLNNKSQFDFIKDEKELRQFIKSNFIAAKTGTNKINITLNRMTSIFNRWLETVKPTIKAPWPDLAKENILPADFFLADVISKNNQSIGKSLQVLLRSNAYRMKFKMKIGGIYQDVESIPVEFTDKQKAHKVFWNKYNRPPHRKERLQMQERRDLLVEPDRRECNGAFYTPPKWVDLSREYLTKVLGEKWQEEYYVWDCCAGTGNLIYGLTEKERIFASTKEEPDVTYMKSRDNLLPMHVFQFDFLNDDLFGDKVPEDLKRILKDPEERKKLVIYINPPYIETAGKRAGINVSKIKDKYQNKMGGALREIYAQFIIRVYKEIPSCILAEFSKLKNLQAANFADFRDVFRAKLLKMFVVPGHTFDNVDGRFPIGFKIWDCSIDERFSSIEADIYQSKGDYIGKKKIATCDNKWYFSKWITIKKGNKENRIAWIEGITRNDFQSQKKICITNDKSPNNSQPRGIYVCRDNIMQSIVGFAVRYSISADWLNDRDQFLYPHSAWKKDKEFITDCLAYTLFHGQNRISANDGINYWIPFTEKEVHSPMLFESHFMSNLLKGKCRDTQLEIEYSQSDSLVPTEPIQFSEEAQAVMDAGKELWIYYMQCKDKKPNLFNVNASYYDIRYYFQGEDSKGNMSSDSEDDKYKSILKRLKEAQKKLTKKIEPKVYLYGFLLDETTLPEDEPEEVAQIHENKPAKVAKPRTKKTTKNQMVVNNYGTLNIYEK